MTLDQQTEQARAELSELAGRWAEMRNTYGAHRDVLAATPGTDAYKLFRAMEAVRVRYGKLVARRVAKRLAA